MRGAIFSLVMLGATALHAQEFTTLKGHGGPIMGIAVSAQDKVATASFDNSVGLWTGETPEWLEGHAAAVTAIAWAPKGEVLVTGGDDFSVRLWSEGEDRILGHHKGKVAGLAFSPDGTLVVSGSWDGSIVMHDLDAGASHILPSPGANVNDVAFANDGQTLFAATQKGEILAYDLTTGDRPRVIIEHGFGVNRLLPGPGWLAYGAVDGGTRVINPTDSTIIRDVTLERRPILAMDYHPATHQVAVGDGHGYIMMLDAQTWRITRDYRATQQGPIWALAFSADGTVIYAGGLDDAVYAWPIALLGDFDPVIDGNRSFLRDAASMPNGERQFMRKCSICHSLTADPSRHAGPSLHNIFGRQAGTYPGYTYSDRLATSDIIWTADTISALFEVGPDHYIPNSKMPMQVIAQAQDRADLITYLQTATQELD